MFTVVIDTSVFLHQLHRSLKPIDHTNSRWKSLVKAQLAYLVSGNWLGVLKPKEFQIVFAKDQKDSNLKYWRHYWLANPEFVADMPQKRKGAEKKRKKLQESLQEGNTTQISQLAEELMVHYKAGRSLPEYAFSKLKDYTYTIIEAQGWRSFSQKGYEADDVAAAIVQLNKDLNTPNQLLLLTIDTDWMGLIDNHTGWMCMQGYQPRLRVDLDTINLWAQRRLGCQLSAPREIWEIKAKKGDKADNLPESKGVLMPVIDLLNPPNEHKLWLQPVGRDIRDVLEHPIYQPIDADEAEDYIYRCGVQLAVRPFEPGRDLPAGIIEIKSIKGV